MISMAILFLVLFSNCKKDEITLSANSINFIHEDGSLITQSECINPNENYAILIETEAEGEGNFKAITIDFTVNGFLHSMTFTRDGIQKIPITIIDGQNTAQIVSTEHSCELFCVVQGDFELVE